MMRQNGYNPMRNQCETRNKYYDIRSIMELKECDPCTWGYLCESAANLVRATAIAFNAPAENDLGKTMQVAAWFEKLDSMKSVYAWATQAYRYATGKNLFYTIPNYNSWHVQLSIAMALYRDTNAQTAPPLSVPAITGEDNAKAS